jgi:hypothetical protein
MAAASSARGSGGAVGQWAITRASGRTRTAPSGWTLRVAAAPGSTGRTSRGNAVSTVAPASAQARVPGPASRVRPWPRRSRMDRRWPLGWASQAWPRRPFRSSASASGPGGSHPCRADREGAALPVALGDLGRERERALGYDPDRQVTDAGGGPDEAGEAGVAVALQPLVPRVPGPAVQPAVAGAVGHEHAARLRVLDEVDAVAAVAHHGGQRRLEQHRELLGQVAGTVHGDAEPGPDPRVGAVGADQPAGSDGLLRPAGTLPERDGDAAAVLVEGGQLGAETDLGPVEPAQVAEQDRLQVVLGHGGRRRRAGPP